MDRRTFIKACAALAPALLGGCLLPPPHEGGPRGNDHGNGGRGPEGGRGEPGRGGPGPQGGNRPGR